MKKIAIIAALNEEIAPFETVCSNTVERINLKGVRVFSGGLSNLPFEIIGGVIGVGKTLAAMNTQRIIDEYTPSRIFLIGSCGGAISGVAPGDILVPLSTAHSDYDLSCAGYDYGAMKAPGGLLDVLCPTDQTFVDLVKNASADLLAIEERRPAVRIGLMTSRDSLVVATKELSEIEKRFAHIGWDMEAAAVNTVAYLNSIPCSIIKGVLDENGVYDRALAKRIEKSVYENSFRLLVKVLSRI